MKFVLLVLAVLALVYLVRGSLRGRPSVRAQSAKPSPALPQEIVACAHCGLHLPRHEALPGRGGSFCGEAHRAAYEKAHPSP